MKLDTRYSTECLRKQRYRSAVRAQFVARRCEQRRPGTKLKHYHCPHCFGYHLSRV